MPNTWFTAGFHLGHKTIVMANGLCFATTQCAFGIIHLTVPGICTGTRTEPHADLAGATRQCLFSRHLNYTLIL